MVSTSILVDVEESVNELVVKPHKKAKTFSKLIATLLQGYIEDDYIRSYAEGTLGKMHKASVDVLDDALNSMHDSLFSMGVYTSELKSSNENAYNHFNEKAKKAEEDYMRDSEYIKEFKDEISDLRSQNLQIMSMLQDMLSGKSNILPPVSNQVVQQVEERVVPKVEEVKEEVKVVTLVESENKYFNPLEEVATTEGDNIVKDSTPVVVEEDFSESEEENINAADLLANLLLGNEYAF